MVGERKRKRKSGHVQQASEHRFKNER